MNIFIDDEDLKKLIYEGIHFIDLTTQVLEISDLDGVARVFFREPGVVACSEEAARIYKILGADVRHIVKSGVEIEACLKILTFNSIIDLPIIM
jgi:molybdenum transport protein